jgi:predicted PP-loop superfamily ATPase
MTMQHCTDASTDKQMSTSFSPGKDSCAKQDIQKTATGYVSDSVCTVAGMTVTSHAEITGDFNSAYTVKSTAHSERAGGPARDSTTTIEAKWLGACKADQKPGDIMMPGGMKMNILELDKMKSMMPQLPQKAN